MTPHRRLAVFACLALPWLLAAWPAAAQPASADGLTLPRIMAEPDWIGNSPERAWWSDDGASIYFEQKRDASEVRDLHVVAAAGGAARRVEDGELATASVAPGDWSADRRRRVFVREGDVWVREPAAGVTRQLTRTNERESEAQFLTGDREVAYRRGGQEFARDLETGVERQLAELRLEKDPGEEAIEKDYLDEQQERLFDVPSTRSKRTAFASRLAGWTSTLASWRSSSAPSAMPRPRSAQRRNAGIEGGQPCSAPIAAPSTARASAAARSATSSWSIPSPTRMPAPNRTPSW